MSEPVTQWEIYHETRNHLNLVAPLLERIGSGSASQVGVGYVEMDDDTDERFTDAGWSTVGSLTTVALSSTAHLWDVLGDTTGHVDTALLGKVQEFLSVMACALGGLDRETASPGVNPPWVATGLLNMLHALRERLGEEPDRHHPAHEKDAEPVTASVEGPTEATSQPKEPLDAVTIHYRVQEALRPLRMLADSEILMRGRYRSGENDEESDRAEDLARLAKQAHESLRAFEDTGHDPILDEAKDLLWWGQSICVAINALALRLSEDLGSAVPDGCRITGRDAIRGSLHTLSQDAFERVRADGSEIEEAQAAKLKEMEASS